MNSKIMKGMKKECDAASHTFTEKEENVRLRERSDYVYFSVHQEYVEGRK